MKGLIKLARSDYKYARFAYSQLAQTSDCADLNICAYHSQQCVEKLLKYLLEFKGHKYDRTHDISILVDTCVEKGIDVPEVIDGLSAVITTWATQSRYNSEFKTSVRSLSKVLDACEKWLNQVDIPKVEMPRFTIE